MTIRCYKYVADFLSAGVKSESMAMTIIKIILGAALVGALFMAGWSVYRRLPADGTRTESSGARANSEMTIILRGDSAATPVNTRIELYPIDFAAVQRDYSAALRPGKTFDDFLAQRIKGLVPVQPQIDRNGRAQAKLSEGNW